MGVLPRSLAEAAPPSLAHQPRVPLQTARGESLIRSRHRWRPGADTSAAAAGALGRPRCRRAPRCPLRKPSPLLPDGRAADSHAWLRPGMGKDFLSVSF